MAKQTSRTLTLCYTPAGGVEAVAFGAEVLKEYREKEPEKFKQASIKGNLAAQEARAEYRSRGGRVNAERGGGFKNPVNKAKAVEGHRTNTKVPYVMPGSNLAIKPKFESFAKKIRAQTNDGWELIEAVYEVFTRARAAKADSLTIEAATWLADRGFGKPVQVGQLLDGEGNAVAFTLWSPANPDQVIQGIAIPEHASEEEQSSEYTPSEASLEAPHVLLHVPKDAYANGPARPWSRTEKDEASEQINS